jgi:hypothetical protein
MKIVSKIIGGFAFATTLAFSTLNTFNASAQENNNRNVGSFSSVDISGGMDVFLTEGSTESVKVEVKGIEAEKVLTEVKGEALKISLKIKNGFSWSWGKGVEIKVYVTYRKLKAISSSGSSDIICNSKLKNESFEIALSGSGDLKASLETANLEVSVSGSADIDLEGKADVQNIAISGSGNFKGRDLEGKEVKVRISGSGDATVWANESIEAKVSGSGDVTYKGNPSKEVSKVSGSGTIKKG